MSYKLSQLSGVKQHQPALAHTQNGTFPLHSTFFLIDQHSAPYIIVGLITVYTPFLPAWWVTLLSHNTHVICFHFTQGSFAQLLMSLSGYTVESKMNPTHLNVNTVFCFSSRDVLFIVSGKIVIILASQVLCFWPADSHYIPFRLVSPYLQLIISLSLSNADAALEVL